MFHLTNGRSLLPMFLWDSAAGQKFRQSCSIRCRSEFTDDRNFGDLLAMAMGPKQEKKREGHDEQLLDARESIRLLHTPTPPFLREKDLLMEDKRK